MPKPTHVRVIAICPDCGGLGHDPALVAVPTVQLRRCRGCAGAGEVAMRMTLRDFRSLLEEDRLDEGLES